MQHIFFTTANPQLAQVLQSHGLQQFADWWAREVAWFEAPNQRRGGWSGVGRLCLQNAAGADVVLFVKKQQNHGRRTWRHPFAGEPTFRREFQALQTLAAADFLAPSVVYYAESLQSGQQQAVLVTENLHDFVDLEQYLSGLCAMPLKARRATLASIAQALRRFHNLGLVHRALYPKHIFVSGQAGQTQVALIDLEKMRHSACAWWRARFDLSAMQRHTGLLAASDRLFFFKHYVRYGKVLSPALSWMERRLLTQIVRRSRRGSGA